ncbi:MAG: hypothetical protein IJ566_04325 [Cardiobacteriaceae bacterium]|nr:hypothetical protein [Cardiobacteriaceae bacterium]
MTDEVKKDDKTVEVSTTDKSVDNTKIEVSQEEIAKKLAEEKAKKEAEEKKKQEEAAKKAAEEKAKKEAEEKKKQEEAAKKAAEEKKKQEEAAKKQAEEKAKKEAEEKKKQEEAAKKAAEEKLKKTEEELKKQAEAAKQALDEKNKLAAEKKAIDEKLKKAEEEAKKQAEAAKQTLDEKNKIEAEKQKLLAEEQRREEARKVKAEYEQSVKRKFRPLFWLIVIIPTLCAAVYYALFASEIYISESSFVVRTPNGNQGIGQVGALLQTTGIGRAQDDSYTVQEFMQSQAALSALEQKLPIRNFYSDKGDIFARFNGFGLNNSNEAFYQYFRKRISINFDSVSGISTLFIRAFNAEEGKKINQQLLKQAEELINKLNERARKDTLTYAQIAVKDAEERVQKSSEELTNYRIENKLFDLPAVSTVQLNLISSLKQEIITIETQIEQLQAIAPDNPQIKALRSRQNKLNRELAAQSKELAGADNSLAAQSGEYQRLVLDYELAGKELTAAISALHSAKQAVEQHQLYLEVINPPSLPDWAEEPRRIYNTVAIFLISLIIYGVLNLFIAAIREHNN